MSLSERITEGYMYSFFPEKEMVLRDRISHLAGVLKEKHPDFKFNTCWINPYSDGIDRLSFPVDGIKIEADGNILKNHYWFVWIEENKNV